MCLVFGVDSASAQKSKNTKVYSKAGESVFHLYKNCKVMKGNAAQLNNFKAKEAEEAGKSLCSVCKEKEQKQAEKEAKKEAKKEKKKAENKAKKEKKKAEKKVEKEKDKIEKTQKKAEKKVEKAEKELQKAKEEYKEVQ